MSKIITAKTNMTADENNRTLLGKLQSALVDMNLVSGALTIGGTASKIKIAAAIKFVLDGIMYTKAISDNVTLAAKTVTNAKFNVCLISIDKDGTVTSTWGTEGATIPTVVLPILPAANVAIGMIIINPTGTGNFIAATDSLGDSTIVPGAIYINIVGAYDNKVESL